MEGCTSRANPSSLSGRPRKNRSLQRLQRTALLFPSLLPHLGVAPCSERRNEASDHAGYA
jgi:hypothetical protein